MKKTLSIFAVHLLILSLSMDTLFAYDSHHPNPLSILNGRHHRATHSRRQKHEATIRRVRKKQIQAKHKAGRREKWRMYHEHKERKYIIRPEPFSIASKKTDPELLGPQRTYKSSDLDANSTQAAAIDTPKKDAITKEHCISIIGQEKFDHYVKRYGGETGALHRCLVFERAEGT